jgi:hypothetical protein
MYFKALAPIFGFYIYVTVTFSETSRVTDILTVDGRRVLLEDLTLKDCLAFCTWTDSFEAPVVIESKKKVGLIGQNTGNLVQCTVPMKSQMA